MKRINKAPAVIAALTMMISALTAGASADNSVNKRAYYSRYSTPTAVTLDTYNCYGRWASVSEICQFTDNNGAVTLAYDDGDKVHILRYSSTLEEVTKELVIDKYLPLLGDVKCDSNGNYYVIWGRKDIEGTAAQPTIAVSKYSNDGALLATVEQSITGYDFDCRYPFEAGNCATVIFDNTLVCTYAKEMYCGHQANGIIALNIDEMTVDSNYMSYTSHSFNQSILHSSALNKVFYADHGDAYDRAISLEYNVVGENSSWKFYSNMKTNVNVFHFYGSCGDNATNGLLGGLAELSTGIAVVGAGPREMSETGLNGNRDLFISIYDPTSKTYVTQATRSGTCCGEETTDTGVKFLTQCPEDVTIYNPQVVATDDDRVVILYELWNQSYYGGTFDSSYYMILDSAGNVVQPATLLGSLRLNSCEEPIFSGGSVIWANGCENSGENTITLNKLELSGSVSVGDVNANDTANSDDALMVLKSSVGMLTLTDEQTRAADVNCDGRVDSADALLILRFSVGIITSLI